MILVHKETQRPVQNGEYVTDRHGDSFKVAGWTEPTKEKPKGWVNVELEGIGAVPHHPGIFGLEWRLSAKDAGKVGK